ncbi:unnamed protein product [Prorocentrum cordatum]|nr:unnamed protein product [Polarella glacialis]
MDTPGVMTCFIVDRCTSDGCRICPVLLRTELLFDLPSHLRVKACECQLDAFMAMLSDIGQLEEWRSRWCDVASTVAAQSALGESQRRAGASGSGRVVGRGSPPRAPLFGAAS